MKDKRTRGTRHKIQTGILPGAEPRTMKCSVIEVERSGDWMPADELKKKAMVALVGGDDTTLNLEGIDHLDASAMQILLALDLEQKHRGQHVHLVNASPRLRQWFELSGAADHFLLEQRNAND